MPVASPSASTSGYGSPLIERTAARIAAAAPRLSIASANSLLVPAVGQRRRASAVPTGTPLIAQPRRCSAAFAGVRKTSLLSDRLPNIFAPTPTSRQRPPSFLAGGPAWLRRASALLHFDRGDSASQRKGGFRTATVLRRFISPASPTPSSLGSRAEYTVHITRASFFAALNDDEAKKRVAALIARVPARATAALPFRGRGGAAKSAALDPMQRAINEDSVMFPAYAAELAASAPQQRNWRGILIALTVIMAILAIIFLAICILTPLDGADDASKQPISLKDATSAAIMGHIEALEWMDGQRLVVRANDAVELIDFGSEPWSNSTLFDAEALYRHGKVKSTNVIHGTRHIEITYFAEKVKDVGPDSYTTKRLYDTKLGTFENIGVAKTGDERVDALRFSPIGEGYAFVQDFDLYYRPAIGSEVLQRLTANGNTDLRHGLTNWAYAEELFGPEAFWWSEDGEELAFMTTDLRLLNTYNISWYAGRQYPLQKSQRYAKEGVREVEKVWLSVWHRATGRTLNFTVDLSPERRVYLMHASYARFHNENVLVAVFANRLQDDVTYTMCTLATARCVPSFRQSYELGDLHQYATPEQVVVAAYTDDAFYTILPHRQRDGDVFNQIARVSVPRGFLHATESFLPMGAQEVDKIHSYDATRQKIYFSSPAPIHRQMHLYSTSAVPVSPNFGISQTLQQTNAVNEPTCVTCGLAPNCTYHETTFAPNSTKFFMSCKGIGPNTVYVADASPPLSPSPQPSAPPASGYSAEADANAATPQHDSPTAAAKILTEFGQTGERERELISKKFPRVHFENVTLANGFVAFCRIFLPHGVALTEQHRRLPVLVYVYGGPNTHSVHEEWLPEMPVDIYFASTMEYVLVNIDGRGSGNAGWRRRQPMYGHLGTVEVDDQIAATRLLLARHKFMDKKRVGIWGWSYGGFVTAHAIARDNLHTFKCGAMIAPVANFRMYDAIYTERYMGNASEHAYDLTNVALNVTNFHFAKTLLVHGTADDNVHFQNSAELISAFVRENVYPDESHSLKGVRPHLFDTLITFFRTCMDGPRPGEVHL